MAYRIEKNPQTGNKSIVIDGFEYGIAPSPYEGISNMRGLNTTYYPGVAYVNYKRQAATLNGGYFFAGANSTNVGNNTGWIFTAGSVSMTDPVDKAVSPAGLGYILDDSGNIWKQSAVNSSTFTLLTGGTGRVGSGAAGIAYWNNYLVVFGDGLIEFCGKGTDDSDVVATNWNLNTYGPATNSSTFTTNFGSSTSNLNLQTIFYPKFNVGDPVQLTTTGTLPTGLSTNTTYYIKTIAYNNTTGPITISATVGGAAVTFSSDGTGTHTITDNALVSPIGNSSNIILTGTINNTASTLTFSSYTDPRGTTQASIWMEPTGLYDLVFPNGTRVPAQFTYGSGTITLLSPLIYLQSGGDGPIDVELLNSDIDFYNPYVSKVDGSLYFGNGQYIGRLAITSSPNIDFNPGLAVSFSVSASVTALPQKNQDTVVDMCDLNNNLVVAGNKNVYAWDYISASTSSPAPVGEQISSIINVLNNIYILAGQKGNIYVSNGYSAQLFYKLPDFIAGVIDPVWTWGDLMVHRSRLFFQVLAQTVTGTNILAGIFSLIVSPSMISEKGQGLVMENQNSYGLTPAVGASASGVLIDNSPSSSGFDSYYSAWSNGSSIGGIDYNNTTLPSNFEPVIETDIIPIGTILEKETFGNIEFKLDRPMVSGDQLRLSWRPSLTENYTVIGTTSNTYTQLSSYFNSNIIQAQWAQFKVEFLCTTNSSRLPLREIRLNYGRA